MDHRTRRSSWFRNLSSKVTLWKDPFLRPPLCFFLTLVLTSLCLLLLINLYVEFENDILEYQFTSLVSFLALWKYPLWYTVYHMPNTVESVFLYKLKQNSLELNLEILLQLIENLENWYIHTWNWSHYEIDFDK